MSGSIVKEEKNEQKKMGAASGKRGKISRVGRDERLVDNELKCSFFTAACVYSTFL